MATSQSKIEYWNGSAWVEETQWFKFKIQDTLGYPLRAEISISNRFNTKESTYNAEYVRLRILEQN